MAKAANCSLANRWNRPVVEGRDKGNRTDRNFLSRLSCLNREGKHDAFHFRQFLAGLKITPDLSVLVGETAESLALHDRDILYHGAWLFIVAYREVAHRLDQSFIFPRLVLRNFNLHRILKSCCPELAGQQPTDSDCHALHPCPYQVLLGNTEGKWISFKKSEFILCQNRCSSFSG